MKEQTKPLMKPITMKMHRWMLDELKRQAETRGVTVAAYIRDLVMRDLFGERTKQAS